MDSVIVCRIKDEFLITVRSPYQIIIVSAAQAEDLFRALRTEIYTPAHELPVRASSFPTRLCTCVFKAEVEK